MGREQQAGRGRDWRGGFVVAVALGLVACADDGGTRITLTLPDGSGLVDDDGLTYELFYADVGAPDDELVRRYEPGLDHGTVTASELRAGWSWLLESTARHDLHLVAVLTAAGRLSDDVSVWLAAAEVVVEPAVARGYELSLARVDSGPDVARWDDCPQLAPNSGADTAAAVDVWGDETDVAVLGHCVRWRAVDGGPVRSMGWPGDRDCDGVPSATGVACVTDAAQCDRRIPELGVDPSLDLDGDGFLEVSSTPPASVQLDTCRPCVVDGAVVPCECDESPGFGAKVHFGAIETCDGLDTDCDGELDGDEPIAATLCVASVAGGTCVAGVWGCSDAHAGQAGTGDQCLPVDGWRGAACGTSTTVCEGVDEVAGLVSGCSGGGAASVLTCVQRVDASTTPCAGDGNIIADVQVAVADTIGVTCDATLVGGHVGGWYVKLQGIDGANDPVVGVQLSDVRCASIRAVSFEVGPQPIAALLSLTPAGATEPRFLRPLQFQPAVDGESCTTSDEDFACNMVAPNP